METRKTLTGAALLLLQAAAIGLAANAVNPRRLAWVRVPLSETRRVATTGEVLPSAPPPSMPQKATRPSATSERMVAIARPAPPAVSTTPPARAEIPQPMAVPPEGPGKTKIAPVKAPTRPSPPAKDRHTTKGAEERATHPATPAPATPAPESKPRKAGALFTTLPDAKALFDRKDAVFVDARRKEDYDVEHITGALSLFVENVGADYEAVLGAFPKDRTIVTYCSDAQCETAMKLADALVARGHTRVFILLEGIPGWNGAGYPTTGGNL